MNLLDIFAADRLLLDLKAREKKGAIKELVQHLVSVAAIDDDSVKKVERAINKRESQGTTGIGKGIAIPHAKGCKSIKQTVAVFARSHEGVNFSSVDGGLVQLIFLVVSPPAQADEHLQVMRKIAALHKDEKTLKFLKTTENVKSILGILQEIDETFQ